MMVSLTLIAPHSTSYLSLHPKFHPAPLPLYSNSANESITCCMMIKPDRSFSSRLTSYSIPSALRIRSAATKPAKSPGISPNSAFKIRC